MFFVYKLLDCSGNVFYVGAGNEKRVQAQRSGNGRIPAVQKIFNEHCNEGKKVSLVIDSEHDSKESAFLREKELIAEYGKRREGGLLVNICDGGAGVPGYKATEESRKANSQRMKEKMSSDIARKSVSEATKKSMENKELRSYISAKLKEKWSSEEFRLKQIASHTGYKQSEASKAAKSAALRKAWSIGVKVGKYTDEQVSEVYSMKGVMNVKDVAERFGMNPTYVHKIWRHERCVSALRRLGLIAKQKPSEGL